VKCGKIKICILEKNVVNTILDKYHLSVSVLDIDDDFTLI